MGTRKGSPSTALVASSVDRKDLVLVGKAAAVPALLFHAIPAWWAGGWITGLFPAALAFVIGGAPWFVALLAAFTGLHTAATGAVEGQNKEGVKKSRTIGIAGRAMFGACGLAAAWWILFGGWLALAAGGAGAYFLRDQALNGEGRIKGYDEITGGSSNDE